MEDMEYLDHMEYLEHMDAGTAQQLRSFRLREHVCANTERMCLPLRRVALVFRVLFTLFQPEFVGERAASRDPAQLAVQPAAHIAVQPAAQLAA